MKKLLCLMIIGLTLFSVLGCNSVDNKDPAANLQEKSEPLILNLGVPKAPPTIPLLRMMETKAMGDDIELRLDIWKNPENMIAMATEDKYPIMAMPVNIAAQLYNKGVGIKLANVNTWGVIYLVSSDDGVRGWEDLKDKTLYVAFKGAPTDMLTKYLLNKKEMSIGEDIEVLYSAPAEIAQLLKVGKIQNAVNIEPFIQTSRNEKEDNLKVIASYENEWKKIHGEDFNLPNAGIVFKDKFIKDNKEIADRFQAEYKKALEWVIDHPAEAGVLAESHLGFKKEVIEKALPNLALRYKSAAESKVDLELYYEVLSDFEAQSIGGKLPDEAFYYGE